MSTLELSRRYVGKQFGRIKERHGNYFAKQYDSLIAQELKGEM